MTGKLNSRQIALMIIMSSISDMGLFLPVLTTGSAKQDAWISVIIGTLAGMAIGLAIAGLAVRLRDLSFGMGAKRLLGPALGTAAGLAVGLFLYFILLTVLRMFSLLIGVTILPNTPNWVISSTLLVTAIYGALTGADSLGRAAELLLTFASIAIVAAFLVLIITGHGMLDLGLLKPVLARGIGPVIEGAITPTFWYSISSSIVLALGKTCLDRQNLVKAVTWAVIVSGIFLVCMVLAVIMTIGPQLASEQLSPPLTMARTIFLSGVFERAEIVLIALWMLGTSFDIAISLLTSSIILGDTLKQNTSTVIKFLGAIAVIVTGLEFNTIFDFIILYRTVNKVIALILIYVLIIGTVYIISVVRRKENANGKT
jgi:spore germination protein KB